MAASNDISYALDLARSVFEICCEPPEEFSPGASAAQEIISVLEDFNRFKSSLESNPTNGEKEDFSLNKNLAPCIESLQKIESIRNKYNRRTSMGLSDKFRWRSDNDKFAKEILALLSVATVLQETVDLIKIMAERAQAAANAAAAQPKSPIREPAAPPPLPSTPKSSLPQPVTPTRVPVAITHVSIYNTPSTPTARIRTSPATRIPTRSPTQTRTPPRQGTTAEHSRTNPKGQLPLCPNGSGCRVPLCFQSHNHPAAKACDEGKDCPIPTCTRWHPQSRLCEIGPACPMTNCPRAHPWPRTTAAEGYLPSPVSPITGGGFEGRGPSDSVSSLDTNNNGPTIVTLISELGITSEADVELEAAVEPGPGPATSARTGAGTGFAAKCPKQYACPGGYNGECLLWHPRRQPCANGLLCRKGSRCTFDHSHLSNLPKSAPQYSELPAMGHRGGR